MSKMIRLTDEYRAECVREFIEALRNMRMTDGKVSYSKTLGAQTNRARVLFTPVAWAKMTLLIKNFDKEVAWHGVASRGEGENENAYIISDILVYPQKVTSATVETDQEEYERWLCDLPDEVFNSLRMQGHSHVNMGVTPSGVDTTHQGKILQQLDEDMFYIFMIWNKSFNSWIKIYDFRENIMFESSDIDVQILGSGFDPEAFMKESRTLVRTQVPAYSGAGYNSGAGYGSGTGYGYGGGYGSSSCQSGSGAQGKPWTPPSPAQHVKKAETELKKTNDAGSARGGADGNDDGWRSHYGGSGSSFADEDDDDAFWSGSPLYSENCLRDPFYARGY